MRSDLLYLPIEMYISALNLVLCGLVAWSAMCRLNMTNVHTQPRVRAQLVALLVGVLCDGLQPVLWNSQPTFGSLLLVAALLIYMWLGVKRWRRGAPPGTARSKARL